MSRIRNWFIRKHDRRKSQQEHFDWRSRELWTYDATQW